MKNEMDIKELVKNEIEFCNEIDCEKNEHGQFIYESKNGKSTMNLPYVLQEYKQWLIDKRMFKESSAACDLGGVISRRKLLLDYAEYSENDKTSTSLDECVDNYLDSIKQ